MKLAVLIITLITGETGPIEMDEAKCWELHRQFMIGQRLGLPAIVDMADGRSEIAIAMTCQPKPETAGGPTS